MEFILQNTDIFDKEIDVKLNNILLANTDKFITGTVYKFTIIFHVNLLNDIRFKEFDVPDSCKLNKGKKNENIEDKITDVLGFQLDKLNHILDKNGMEVYSSTIQGDTLESKNIIKIEISEDNSDHLHKSKVGYILPDMPYIKEMAFKVLAKVFARNSSKKMG